MSTVEVQTESPPNEPSSCLSSLKHALKKMCEFVKGYAFFFIFLLSLLLIGLEELMEVKFFVCPCRHNLNIQLTAAIFIGPALFIFELLFFFLRPFRNRCCCSYSGLNAHSQQNCPKAFSSCAIPSIMWVIILLFDGDYVACAMTYWKGTSVFDSQLNRSWCKPIESFRKETVLRDLTQKYIHQSQIYGYAVSSIFIVLPIICLGIYDCYEKRRSGNRHN